MATFSDLTLSQAGDYEIQVSSDSLETVFDIPITVTASTLQATTTTLNSSPNPSTCRQWGRVHRDRSSPDQRTGIPTGTVTFTIDTVPEPPVNVMDVNGVAQANFVTGSSALSVGTHTIGATYNGDSTFATSTVGATPDADREPGRHAVGGDNQAHTEPRHRQ